MAPGRIEFGSQFTFQEDENFLNDDVFSILKLRSSSAIINDLILRKEMIEYAWNRFVLNYDQGMQFSLFSRLFDSVSQAKIYFTIFGLVILFVAVIAFLVLRKPAEKPLPPATSLYLKFCKFLADNGISRRAGETPLHFRDRVVAIQPGWKTDVCRITDIYMELAFASAGEGTEERMRQLRQAIRRFKVIN